MCGRIANAVTPGYLREQFDEAAAADILEEPGLLPRYNLTPGQFLPGIRALHEKETEWTVFRWGLIPRWAKPDFIPDKTFNARSETAKQKPTFRDAYKKRRCIIPVSGYYEWTGSKGNKQPHYFHQTNDQLLLMAGLWESWQNEDTIVETCTILTMDSENHLKNYHHRMPVFLEKEQLDTWLTNPDPLDEIVAHVNTTSIQIYPVSKEVNNSRVDHPGLIQELSQLF